MRNSDCQGALGWSHVCLLAIAASDEGALVVHYLVDRSSKALFVAIEVFPAEGWPSSQLSSIASGIYLFTISFAMEDVWRYAHLVIIAPIRFTMGDVV